ncbi:MFS general substrate transporter [Aspergillus cavernicola]|uniref:MFS general substrate transporter n=1 Tax=Aspergillus cavernicola TaxID=176166 RepID=A0ABR4HNU9_9EURO
MSQSHPPPTAKALQLRDPVSSTTPTPTDDQFPEGGYGWICVICIFLINAHTWGINSAYGVILSFYLSHDEFPGTPALSYAFVSGLSISCALLIAPIVTYLSPVLSTRVFIILGVLLETASMIGASFVTQSWQLFLSQGICFGFGMGSLFISTVGIPNQWFKRRRGVANGIVAAGSGTGGLVYSLATNRMIENLGFRWAFRVLGIISFTVNLISGLILRERRVSSSTTTTTKKKKGGLSSSLIQQPAFLGFLSWGFFSILGYIALLFSLASYARAVGLDSNTGSLASALLNLGQALGRPLVGALSDKFGRIETAAIASALCGLFCMVFWPFASREASLFAFSILAGLGAGTIWASAAAIAAELVVELRAVPGALSVLWLVLVVPGTVAEVIALQLRDPGSVQGPYFPVQMFTGVMYLAAAGSLGVVFFFARRDLLLSDG